MSNFAMILAALILALSPGKDASARELVAGPVAAVALEAIDGDSLKVLANVWPGAWIAATVRLRAIDAPERNGKCALERAKAEGARAALAALILGEELELRNIEGDKYFARVLADVVLAGAADDIAARPPPADIATRLLAGGHARAYGGGRRLGWCSGQE